jgi:AsmA family protein
MSRSGKWIATGIAIVVLLALGIYFFDWNLMRGFIAHRVEQATGRNFAINGDLHVRLSLHPRITAQGLVLGNAEWSDTPNMAEIGFVDVVLDIPALLRREFVIPAINLSDARLLLEKNKDGTPNWVFDEKSDKKSGAFPDIGSLTIDHAQVQYRDPTIDTDITADISSATQGVDAAQRLLQIDARGRYKGMKGTAGGKLGALLALRSPDNPYPINFHAAFGSTKASIEGTLLDPLHFKGVDANFDLAGSDLAQMFPLVGVPLPPTPPYKLSGHLVHTGDVWTFRQFNGAVGRSNLAGDFSVDVGQKPQMITADLRSRNLDMNDLGGLIGGRRGDKPAPKQKNSDRVLPQEPFKLEKLNSANADVKFKGERILTEKLPLEHMETHLKLKDGVLQLDPLNFGVAGGNLLSEIQMNARQQVIKTSANIRVKELHLDKLFPSIKESSRVNAGLIGGRAKFDTTGNSMAKMLGDANGEAAFIMQGGTVSELVLHLSNLDVANSIATLLTGDKSVPIRCMVSHFKVDNGDFITQTMLLDTEKGNITGSGDINFKNESLNLQLVAKPKGFSLAALRGPINVKGTLTNPKVLPSTQAIGRGALAAVAGAVTAGLGAFIPLLDYTRGRNNNCAALIESTQQVAATGKSANERNDRIGATSGRAQTGRAKKQK